MAELSRTDLCIIGAGALGIALASYARQLGAVVVLADRGLPEPGDQPLRAMRLSALAASGGFVAAARRGVSMGLGSVEAKLSFKGVQERVAGVVSGLDVAHSAERLAAQGVALLPGPVAFADQRTVRVGDLELRPRHVVIATGGQPIIPDVPGLGEIDYFTADSIFDNIRKLTHLLVIGGDADALALAQIHRRLGSEVTLVPQGGLLPDHDEEAVAILLDALRAEGIKVMQGARVSAIQPRAQGTGAVVATARGEDEALDVSHVLVSMGRVPDLAGIGIEHAKLRPLKANAAHHALGPLGQTSSRTIRVAGGAAGIFQWHEAMVHGRAVIDSVLLGPTRRPLPVQPKLVLTEPALAQIGKLPGPGDQGKPGRVLVRANISENHQARALGTAHGVVKVLARSNGRVEGASVVGPQAGELAGVLALAMGPKVTLADLAAMPMPHPSLMGSLVAIGENYLALRPVSSFMARIQALRQVMPR